MDDETDSEASSDVVGPEDDAGTQEEATRQRFLGMDERWFIIGLTLLALGIVTLAVFLVVHLLRDQGETLPPPAPMPNPVAQGFQ
ncbi:MAG: hypothetical protein MUP92_02295, partial [Actinobacteria bacterium]|nr:hypothetical protein [Actinomycetota bacterium]